jgi:hypothetical protein
VEWEMMIMMIMMVVMWERGEAVFQIRIVMMALLGFIRLPPPSPVDDPHKFCEKKTV